MKTKLTGLAGFVVILLAGILIARAFSNAKQQPHHKPLTKAQKQVKTQTVHTVSIAPKFTTGGTVHAYNKIMLFAEVNGVLHQADTPFRAGNRFTKGQVLLRIDDAVYRNNVLAQKSALLNQLTLFIPDLAIDYPQSAKRWQAYLNAFDLNRPLAPLPVSKDNKEKYFIASRTIYTLYYQVKSMEATLAKYTLRAPYNGIVTESDVTPGTLVRAGQKLGEFTSTSLYEVEVPIPISVLTFLKAGDRVRLFSEELQTEFSGTLSRINQKIDRNSQTVQAFISVSHPALRDGMYLSASIRSRKKVHGAFIPVKWLVDSRNIYVLQDSTFHLRPVQITLTQGDNALVQGLQDNETILAQEAAVNDPSVPFNRMY